MHRSLWVQIMLCHCRKKAISRLCLIHEVCFDFDHWIPLKSWLMVCRNIDQGWGILCHMMDALRWLLYRFMISIDLRKFNCTFFMISIDFNIKSSWIFCPLSDRHQYFWQHYPLVSKTLENQYQKRLRFLTRIVRRRHCLDMPYSWSFWALCQPFWLLTNQLNLQ